MRFIVSSIPEKSAQSGIPCYIMVKISIILFTLLLGACADTSEPQSYQATGELGTISFEVIDIIPHPDAQQGGSTHVVEFRVSNDNPNKGLKTWLTCSDGSESILENETTINPIAGTGTETGFIIFKAPDSCDNPTFRVQTTLGGTILEFDAPESSEFHQRTDSIRSDIIRR